MTIYGQSNPDDPCLKHDKGEGCMVHGPMLDCLECRDDINPCQGTVEYRMPLSGTGQSFPRCDKHWRERLDVQDGINRRYPTYAPSDFDPSYAGESWDEDY